MIFLWNLLSQSSAWLGMPMLNRWNQENESVQKQILRTVNERVEADTSWLLILLNRTEYFMEIGEDLDTGNECLEVDKHFMGRRGLERKGMIVKLHIGKVETLQKWEEAALRQVFRNYKNWSRGGRKVYFKAGKWRWKSMK